LPKNEAKDRASADDGNSLQFDAMRNWHAVGRREGSIMANGRIRTGLSAAIHKCGYISNGRKKSFDRITGFTGFFPGTQEESC
jgi:hypothetical protein